MPGAPGAKYTFYTEAIELAKAGVVSLLPNPPYARPPIEDVVVFEPSDKDGIVQEVKEMRRGIDVLVSRPEVDPSRLGYVGFSWGASLGGIFSAVERRVHAFVLMRLLWEGGEQTHRGKHYTVDHARIYNLPDEPLQLAIAAGAPNAAEMAAKHGDALVNSAPDPEVVEAFEANGGNGKPRYGMLHACWGEDEDAALETARRLWANIALKGELGRELPRPTDFEDAVQMISKEDMNAAFSRKRSTICGRSSTISSARRAQLATEGGSAFEKSCGLDF